MHLNRRKLILCLILCLLFFAAFVSYPCESTAAQASASPTLAPSPTPEPAAQTPEPTPFSIVWIADTQNTAYAQPDVFYTLGSWIANNAKNLNIVQVVQTGDLVDSGSRAREWNAFFRAYDLFHEEIPYVTVAGNHDLNVLAPSYNAFLSQRFLDELPAEQKFEGGKALYAFLTAGGTDFILVGVGFSAGEQSVEWASSVLSAYPNHVAILLFHSYLHPRLGLYEEGPMLYSALVAPHQNVRLVLCGHFRGDAFRIDTFDDDSDGQTDRTVYTMMQNFQHYNPDGQIRLLTFDPLARSITVDTFSTVHTAWHYRDSTLRVNPFLLDNAF